jgi:Stress responsive A/B Barrel Domain
MSLRHLVLLGFKPEASATEIASIEFAFCALKHQIDVIRDIEWGVDVSPEGLSQGFTHAFVLSFDNAADRDIYLPHPAHQTFVSQMQPWLERVLVLDFVASSSSLH